MEQYINKSALVAELNNRINLFKDIKNETTITLTNAWVGILSFINTLDVKEVELEENIKEEYLKRRCYGGKDNMLVILNEPQFNAVAKHFFELGMAVSNKAQKEE